MICVSMYVQTWSWEGMAATQLVQKCKTEGCAGEIAKSLWSPFLESRFNKVYCIQAPDVSLCCDDSNRRVTLKSFYPTILKHPGDLEASLARARQ